MVRRRGAGWGDRVALRWEEKLLAVGHFGKPFELDAASLSTVLGNEDEGSWNMDGALDESGMGSSPPPGGTKARMALSPGRSAAPRSDLAPHGASAWLH